MQLTGWLPCRSLGGLASAVGMVRVWPKGGPGRPSALPQRKRTLSGGNLADPSSMKPAKALLQASLTEGTNVCSKSQQETPSSIRASVIKGMKPFPQKQYFHPRLYS